MSHGRLNRASLRLNRPCPARPQQFLGVMSVTAFSLYFHMSVLPVCIHTTHVPCKYTLFHLHVWPTSSLCSYSKAADR